MWLAVLGFTVMEVVSGLSLANHSDSESFLVVHASFSQDGCQRERTLSVGDVLLVPCSLPGPYANGYCGAWPG